jgi:SAM-dependent methyltransferase
MNLNGLFCPACARPLTHNDPDAQRPSPIKCLCGASYPILNGIPRLVDSQDYTKSFGFQWNTFDVQRVDDDRDIFKVKTSAYPDELKGLRVLDAGCGGGRYAYLVGKAGATLEAIDLSSAVEKAKGLCYAMDNVRIVQGDLLKLPYAPASFDFVYSIGVLHHTPNTKKAFQSVAKMVKPGGRMAVWIYRKNTWPQEIINTSLRAITSRLPHWLLKPLMVGVGAGLGGIPVVNTTLARVVSFGSSVPDWRLRACDAFDWYSPKYQFHHTPDEVRSWYEEEGFTDIQFLRPQKSGKLYDWAYDKSLLNGSGVNFVGVKK